MPIQNSKYYKTAKVLLLTSNNQTHRIGDSATFILFLEPKEYEKRFFGRLFSSVTQYDPGLVASSLVLMTYF